MSLFVFARGNPQQNGASILTPVFDSVFMALSDGTIPFCSSFSKQFYSQSEIFVLVALKAAMERKKNGTI